MRSGGPAGPTKSCDYVFEISGLARDAGSDGPDAIAGKPAPTNCLRSDVYTDRLQRSVWELACQR